MTEIYPNRSHVDIPKRVRRRIADSIEATINEYADNPHHTDMTEDLIDIAFDAYHVGWQAGFIDDSQPDPTEVHIQMHQRDESIMGALEELKKTIDNSRMVFNPGGTK